MKLSDETVKAINEFQEAWFELKVGLGKTLKIDKVLDWISKKLGE